MIVNIRFKADIDDEGLEGSKIAEKVEQILKQHLRLTELEPIEQTVLIRSDTFPFDRIH